MLLIGISSLKLLPIICRFDNVFGIEEYINWSKLLADEGAAVTDVVVVVSDDIMVGESEVVEGAAAKLLLLGIPPHVSFILDDDEL